MRSNPERSSGTVCVPMRVEWPRSTRMCCGKYEAKFLASRCTSCWLASSKTCTMSRTCCAASRKSAMVWSSSNRVMVTLISNDNAPNEIRTSALAINAKRTPIDCVENLDIICSLSNGNAVAGSCAWCTYNTCSSKQLHIPAHIHVEQAARVIAFPLQHGNVVQLAQFLHQLTPGDRKEVDLAGAIIEQVLLGNLYVFLAQILDDETCVALA